MTHPNPPNRKNAAVFAAAFRFPCKGFALITMARSAAKPWETQLRRLIKASHGRGWVLAPHRGGRTQITRRWSDGARSSVTAPIQWAPGNSSALLALVERLARTMAEQQVGLAQAAGQLALEDVGSSAAAIRDGAVNWIAAADRFRHHLVEQTGRVQPGTWNQTYRRHVAEALLALRERPAPRDGRAVLEAVLRKHPTPPGGTGRRERLGNISRFLLFAVAECGAPGRYRPPSNRRDLIGIRLERRSVSVPLLDDQLLRLLAAIQDPQWRLAVGLLGVFGLRPAELGCCRAETGALRVAGVKRNSSGRSPDRLVQPLDPQAAPGLGGELLAILRERGTEALPNRTGAAYWSTRVQQHLVRHVSSWQSLLAEAAATGQGHLMIYSLRHGFAWRGSQLYGLSPRVLAKLMGHNPETHLRHYGSWSSEAETAAAVEAARVRLMGEGSIPSISAGFSGCLHSK